jgi:hypothetical protein
LSRFKNFEVILDVDVGVDIGVKLWTISAFWSPREILNMFLLQAIQKAPNFSRFARK